MITDITQYPKGYLNRTELDEAKRESQNIHFIKRKYNQVNYLINILRKLDDLIFRNKELYFEEDARVIFGEDLKIKARKRDNYLQRLYKNYLKEESRQQLGSIQCMLEHLDYPSLVASHIKPFNSSSDEEAYDPNNGLLLSRNMDILFDQGYISFEDTGKIMVLEELSEDLTTYLEKYALDKKLMSKERIKYLKYHRTKVFR